MNGKDRRLEKDVAVAEAYAAYLFALVSKQRAKSSTPSGEQRESGGLGPSTNYLPLVKSPDELRSFSEISSQSKG